MSSSCSHGSDGCPFCLCVCVSVRIMVRMCERLRITITRCHYSASRIGSLRDRSFSCQIRYKPVFYGTVGNPNSAWDFTKNNFSKVWILSLLVLKLVEGQREGSDMCGHTMIIWVLLIFLICFQFHTATGPDGGSVKDKVVGVVGRGVLLPSSLRSPADILDETVEWTRSGQFVHLHRNGGDLFTEQNLAYQDRTKLFLRELKKGNASLLISDLKHSDAGLYRCLVPQQQHTHLSEIELVLVQTVSKPQSVPCEISILDDGKILQCVSEGWYDYVRPKVSWQDGEGNDLPAEESEETTYPDGLQLHTVRRNVTAKSVKNNSTCTCMYNMQNMQQQKPALVEESSYHGALFTGLGIGLGLAIVLTVIWKYLFPKCRNYYCSTEEESNKTNQNNPALEQNGYNQEQEINLRENAGTALLASPPPNLKPVDKSTPQSVDRADDSGYLSPPTSSDRHSVKDRNLSGDATQEDTSFNT